MWEVITPPVCSQWICWKPNCQAVSSAARRAEGDSRGVTPSQRSRRSSWNRWAYSRIIRGITRSMLPWYFLADRRWPWSISIQGWIRSRLPHRTAALFIRPPPRRKPRLRMTKHIRVRWMISLAAGTAWAGVHSGWSWRALATWSTTRHWPAETCWVSRQVM